MKVKRGLKVNGLFALADLWFWLCGLRTCLILVALGRNVTSNMLVQIPLPLERQSRWQQPLGEFPWRFVFAEWKIFLGDVDFYFFATLVLLNYENWRLLPFHSEVVIVRDPFKCSEVLWKPCSPISVDNRGGSRGAYTYVVSISWRGLYDVSKLVVRVYLRSSVMTFYQPEIAIRREFCMSHDEKG